MAQRDYLFTCHFCEKYLFRTRKAARKHMHSAHPGEHLNAYECPIYRGWHYGNLPPGGRNTAETMQKEKLRKHYG